MKEEEPGYIAFYDLDPDVDYTNYYASKGWKIALASSLVTFGLEMYNSTLMKKGEKDFERIAELFSKEPTKEEIEEIIYFAQKLGRERLIDEIKLCIAFENYMKAILMDKGYIIHQIESKVQSEEIVSRQRKEPIKRNEFFKLFPAEAYQVNGKNRNKSSYLKNVTLKFNWLMSEKYKSIINLPPHIFNFLEQWSKNRNKLHFHVQKHLRVNKELCDEFQWVDKFVKENIVPFKIGLDIDASKEKLKGHNGIIQKIRIWKTEGIRERVLLDEMRKDNMKIN